MTLFDLAPKESPRSLFGREKELAELVRLIEARRWVAVLGPRMVGKTSLVKAARSQLGLPGAYVNLWGVRTFEGLLEGLALGLGESRSLLARVRTGLRRVDGVAVGPGGITVSVPKHPAQSVWDLLDLVGSEKKTVLIELDEVQEMAPNSGALLKLLGNLFNTHPNLVFVFTGSMFGLMRTLLEPTSGSPLYGRSPVPLRLGPFGRSTAEEFLRRGAKEGGVRLSDDDLDAAVGGPLDGTPGWLTLFGNHLTVRRLPAPRALEETVREGKKVAADEILHFLEKRDVELYWPALKVCAIGGGWTAVRTALARKGGGPVNNGTVRRVLQGLEGENLIVHQGGSYQILDPMVRAYVRDAARSPK
jgi:uncharacterized protein